jgi:hypothetical protein
VNRLPSFQRFAISGFPVGQYRRDLEARLKIKRERGLILETNVYGAILRGKGQFHVSNDLAFDLREPENFPYSTGAGNFIGSQLRLLAWCGWLGARSCATTARPVTRLYADDEWESKKASCIPFAKLLVLNFSHYRDGPDSGLKTSGNPCCKIAKSKYGREVANALVSSSGILKYPIHNYCRKFWRSTLRN